MMTSEEFRQAVILALCQNPALKIKEPFRTSVDGEMVEMKEVLDVKDHAIEILATATEICKSMS